MKTSVALSVALFPVQPCQRCHCRPNAGDFFQDSPIRWRLDLADLPDRPLHAEWRHHVFLATKDALNIAVEDNGAGFDAATAANGSGLQNMRRRIERIGGRFTLDPAPAQGARIHFAVPLASRPQPVPA